VSLVIYDLLGNKIKSLVDKTQIEGNYAIEYSGTENPSGVYFYTLSADGINYQTKKMVLLK
jgi:hypothetical protein